MKQNIIVTKVDERVPILISRTGKMVRFHGAIAALAGGFSLVLLTFTISRNISSTPIRASVVLSSQEHPTLTRKCFLYNNVTAENVCCRMHQYKRDTDILRCIKRANIEALASLR